MRIEGYPEKKNQLIGRLTGLTGKQAIYNGAPNFTYDIGDYRVMRDGSIAILEENLDSDVLDTLISEKLLVDPNPDLAKEIDEPVEEATPAIDPEPDQESKSEAAPAWNYGVANEAHVYDNPIVIRARRIPIKTMVNLINMLYSKGEILSSVVGRPKAFWVSEVTIAEIPYQKPTSYQSLMKIIKRDDRVEMVRGIEFKPDAVIFTGFPETDDFLKRKAYEKLAECLYEHASEKNWISSKRTECPNEKYFCRNFFNRIGLGGAENKSIRELLMKNLCGNSAYRTREQLVAVRSRRHDATVKRRREAVRLTAAM